MNRVIACFTVFSIYLAACDINAQDNDLLDRLYCELSASCAEIKYDYETQRSGIRTIGNGTLLLQGDMWRMDGNGIQMWCDATSLWVADPSLKEAVIEPAEDGASGEFANPALLFMHLNELFRVREVRETQDGKALLYIMVPKNGGNIEYCNIELARSDASIRKGEFMMSDGNVITVTVTDMTLLPEAGIETFRPSGIFDSSWIVTDMR